MFLKQEKPELDDFERKTNFCSKAKSLQNIFAYPFVSEKKNLHFLLAWGRPPFSGR